MITREEIEQILLDEYIRNKQHSIDCIKYACFLSIIAFISTMTNVFTKEVTIVFCVLSIISNAGYWLFKNECKKIFNIITNDEAIESFTKFTNERIEK